MSATFKNAKKLAKQEQLRKLMKDYKKVKEEVKKVDSPLAKYNDLGQLSCILCKVLVKSEAIWVVHINSKQHKQNVEIAKNLKVKTNNFTTPLKRPLTPPLPEVPEKKIKSILKNAIPKKSQVVDSKPITAINGQNNEEKVIKQPILPANNSTEEKTEEEEEDDTSKLPEGFFDDPVKDAKARNTEYKDPMEMEWDRFLKEMKVVENESEAIISGDQDEATNERHMEEIEEQMALFNKVLDLEKKKEDAIELLNKLKKEPRLEEEADDDEIEEFLDWRQKKSY